MNRISVLVVLAASAASVCSGQWLETKITLPDSFWVYDLCYDPLNNKVYCAVEYPNGNVTVIDGATNQVVATVPTGGEPGILCHNTRSNKVHCAGRDTFVTVIDGASDSVIAAVAPILGAATALCYNSRENKVYCANDMSNTVTVIGGATNQVLRSIGVGKRPRAFCHNPQQNRVYVAHLWSSTISVLRDSMTGVEETPKVRPLSAGAVTIVRGCLFLPASVLPADHFLLCADGRKAMELKPGANDLMHLSPGVYFYRLDTPGRRDVQKLVLVR